MQQRRRKPCAIRLRHSSRRSVRLVVLAHASPAEKIHLAPAVAELVAMLCVRLFMLPAAMQVVGGGPRGVALMRVTMPDGEMQVATVSLATLLSTR